MAAVVAATIGFCQDCVRGRGWRAGWRVRREVLG